MANKIYVGDVGVVFRVTTGIDLTTAETMKLLVQRPDSTTAQWTATVYGPSVNGILTYTSVSGDFPCASTYRLQAYVELGPGGADGKFYGETVNFVVYDAYR